MEKDSIASRTFLCWFKHRIEEFRTIKMKIDDELNVQNMLPKLL